MIGRHHLFAMYLLDVYVGRQIFVASGPNHFPGGLKCSIQNLFSISALVSFVSQYIYGRTRRLPLVSKTICSFFTVNHHQVNQYQYMHSSMTDIRLENRYGTRVLVKKHIQPGQHYKLYTLVFINQAVGILNTLPSPNRQWGT
jgi:hypothetical protein